jgi:hypothetical protein
MTRRVAQPVEALRQGRDLSIQRLLAQHPNGTGIAVHLDGRTVTQERGRGTGPHDGGDARFTSEDGAVAEDPTRVRDHGSGGGEEWTPWWSGGLADEHVPLLQLVRLAE